MYNNRDQKKQRKMPSSSRKPDWGMFSPRPFMMQLKRRSQLPDLKTSLTQAERYGHHLAQIQPAGIASGTPMQMLSATDEEEKKFMLGVNFQSGKLTGNQDVFNIGLKMPNLSTNLHKNYQKDININSRSKKQDAEKKTQSRSTSTDKNYAEHLTSPTLHKASENKTPEDTSVPQDPEVKRLLNKGKMNNLAESGRITQQQNQGNFIAPLTTYNEDEKTATPKAGTRGQYLAKREAINILSDRKEFTATQRKIKQVSGRENAKSESVKAKDNQHQVKLKNAAELVRDQVKNEDREMKEKLRGNFHLEPDIVAKEGGEELILQKMS